MAKKKVPMSAQIVAYFGQVSMQEAEIVYPIITELLTSRGFLATRQRAATVTGKAARKAKSQLGEPGPSFKPEEPGPKDRK
jgi:hypothetical protein